MNNKGYVALSIVLVLLVVTIAISTTYAFLAIGEGQSSLAHTKGVETLGFVEGCVEDALQKAHDSDSFDDTSITRPEGTCSVVVDKAGATWTLTVSTGANDYKRTVQVVINRAPPAITLTSWREM